MADEIGFLETTPDQVGILTGYLGDAAWRWKPAPDQWSCLEVVAHLRDIEQEMYGAFVLRVLQEERPALAGRFDAAGLARERRYNDLDPAEALGAFALARARTVAALRAAPSASRDRVWVDRDGAERTLTVLLRRFANHDGLHIGQIARVKRSQRAY